MTEPVVVITLKEVYEKLVDVLSKIDRALDKQDGHDHIQKDHETRIRTLERARWPLPSIAALVSVIALVISFVRPWGQA